MCTNIDETSNSKRKALELITNIFRKKSKECLKNWNETENYPPAPTMNTPSEPTDVAASIVDSQKEASTSSFYLSEFGIPPHSPVSPRVKNIDEDMEALTLSRQDNPFIASKLEKLSASEELLSSSSSLTIQHDDNNISTPTTSTNDCYYHQHHSPSNKTGSSSLINPSLHNLEIEEITQDDSNLHQHLIRSPPPQFPTKLSHFVFPLPNSPIRNISSRYGAFLSPDHRSESKSDYRSDSINLSTKPLTDKLAFQSTHSLSIKSPPKIFNTYRKNSMGHIGDKLINQSSSSSSSSSSSTSDNVAHRSSSESFKRDLTKLPKTAVQSSNETFKNTDHHSLNDPKSSSASSSNKEHCNNVIDYLKGKMTGNGSKEDQDKLKDNEDESNNENGLSNSREALISTHSSLPDASN